MTDTFSRNLTISMTGHLALLAVIFVRAVFIPSEPIEIRRAIRVDVVDLPTKMSEEQLRASEPMPARAETKPEPIKEVPKAEPVKTEPVNITKPKADLSKTQTNAIAKLKAMAALDKIKQDVGEAKKSEAKATKPSTVIKGNQVSAGNSLTGLDKIEYDKYFDDLEVKIREQWSIPQWLADGDFKAQVQILIDERGYITKKVFRRSSGNDIFDGQVMAALEASSPLPPPPPRLQGMLSTSGLILNFPE
jgi:colicin import membrane protein